MSNIAGKSYGINVITPLRWWTAIWQKIAFIITTTFQTILLKGLTTLSLIHFARWTIISRNAFPHLNEDQPKERLKYSYMLFESNFNGSWDQYIDSFSFAIPGGLDAFWRFNIKYPKSIPLQGFYDYIRFNQVESEHYYNAYPLASANDLKGAIRLYAALQDFTRSTRDVSDAEFSKAYQQLLIEQQNTLGSMGTTPPMSTSHQPLLVHQATNKNFLKNSTHPLNESIFKTQSEMEKL